MSYLEKYLEAARAAMVPKEETSTSKNPWPFGGPVPPLSNLIFWILSGEELRDYTEEEKAERAKKNEEEERLRLQRIRDDESQREYEEWREKRRLEGYE